MKAALGLALLVSACGGASAVADDDAFHGAANTMIMVERRCTPENADAGRCDPKVIEALVRSSRCLMGARIEARGEASPDGGTPCPAQGAQ